MRCQRHEPVCLTSASQCSLRRLAHDLASCLHHCSSQEWRNGSPLCGLPGKVDRGPLSARASGLGPRYQRYHQVWRLRFRSFSYRSLALGIGAKLASFSSAGETALHLACYSGSLDTVNALLESRAATNIVGINGTPLDIAKRYTQLTNSNLFPLVVPSFS